MNEYLAFIVTTIYGLFGCWKITELIMKISFIKKLQKKVNNFKKR